MARSRPSSRLRWSARSRHDVTATTTRASSVAPIVRVPATSTSRATPVEHDRATPPQLRRRQVPQDRPPHTAVLDVGKIAKRRLDRVELGERRHRPVPPEHGRADVVGGAVGQRRLARPWWTGEQQERWRRGHQLMMAVRAEHEGRGPEAVGIANVRNAWRRLDSTRGSRLRTRVRGAGAAGGDGALVGRADVHPLALRGRCRAATAAAGPHGGDLRRFGVGRPGAVLPPRRSAEGAPDPVGVAVRRDQRAHLRPQRRRHQRGVVLLARRRSAGRGGRRPSHLPPAVLLVAHARRPPGLDGSSTPPGADGRARGPRARRRSRSGSRIGPTS